MFSIDNEYAACLEILFEVLDDLEDIRIGLEQGRDPDFFLAPNFGFDPLQTVGKHCTFACRSSHHAFHSQYLCCRIP